MFPQSFFLKALCSLTLLASFPLLAQSTPDSELPSAELQEWLPLVTVGDAGNQADPLTGKGSVGENFSIGKYDVTAGQYAAFLEAAADQFNTNFLYSPKMESDPEGKCIIRVVGDDFKMHFKAINPDLPVTFVDLYSAARFCNWMQAGGPFVPGNKETETGAYALNGARRGPLARMPGARYFIPTEDELYKSIYYKGGGTDTGYYPYPNRSILPPTNYRTNQGANEANYSCFAKDDLQGTSRLTPVGLYAHSLSPYDALDTAGNVMQWTCTEKKRYQNVNGEMEMLCAIGGSSWKSSYSWLEGNDLESTSSAELNTLTVKNTLGFRVASSWVAPQSSTPAMPAPATYQRTFAGTIQAACLIAIGTVGGIGTGEYIRRSKEREVTERSKDTTSVLPPGSPETKLEFTSLSRDGSDFNLTEQEGGWNEVTPKKPALNTPISTAKKGDSNETTPENAPRTPVKTPETQDSASQNSEKRTPLSRTDENWSPARMQGDSSNFNSPEVNYGDTYGKGRESTFGGSYESAIKPKEITLPITPVADAKGSAGRDSSDFSLGDTYEQGGDFFFSPSQLKPLSFKATKNDHGILFTWPAAQENPLNRKKLASSQSGVSEAAIERSPSPDNLPEMVDLFPQEQKSDTIRYMDHSTARLPQDGQRQNTPFVAKQIKKGDLAHLLRRSQEELAYFTPKTGSREKGERSFLEETVSKLNASDLEESAPDQEIAPLSREEQVLADALDKICEWSKQRRESLDLKNKEDLYFDSRIKEIVQLFPNDEKVKEAATALQAAEKAFLNSYLKESTREEEILTGALTQEGISAKTREALEQVLFGKSYFSEKHSLHNLGLVNKQTSILFKCLKEFNNLIINEKGKFSNKKNQNKCFKKVKAINAWASLVIDELNLKILMHYFNLKMLSDENLLATLTKIKEETQWQIAFPGKVDLSNFQRDTIILTRNMQLIKKSIEFMEAQCLSLYQK